MRQLPNVLLTTPHVPHFEIQASQEQEKSALHLLL